MFHIFLSWPSQVAPMSEGGHCEISCNIKVEDVLREFKKGESLCHGHLLEGIFKDQGRAAEIPSKTGEVGK